MPPLHTAFLSTCTVVRTYRTLAAGLFQTPEALSVWGSKPTCSSTTHRQHCPQPLLELSPPKPLPPQHRQTRHSPHLNHCCLREVAQPCHTWALFPQVCPDLWEVFLHSHSTCCLSQARVTQERPLQRNSFPTGSSKFPTPVSSLQATSQTNNPPPRTISTNKIQQNSTQLRPTQVLVHLPEGTSTSSHPGTPRAVSVTVPRCGECPRADHLERGT